MNEAARAAPVESFAYLEALAAAAAAALGDRLAEVLSLPVVRARFAVSGGSTPARTYQHLAQVPIDWGRVDMTLTDERWVEPDSPDSNERMVRETLLTGPAARSVFHPLWSDAPDPETGALQAGGVVRERLLPLDLLLLGMGEDGHVASLFPGSPALTQGLDPEGERLCIAVPPGQPAPSLARLSLTLRALLASKMIVLLIAGEAKRQVVERAAAGEALPVSALLLQDRAPVHILWAP